MAYGGGGIYSAGGSFTTSCLDDIPFKLAPKFLPPAKVLLPPGFDLLTPSRSTALSAEYSFEVEEAVLKWSAERERQQEELNCELERQATLRRTQQDSDGTDSGSEPSDHQTAVSDSQPDYENAVQPTDESLYENTAGMLYPKPAPRPRIPSKSNYANVTIPNPLIANISNNILTPTVISSTSSGSSGSDNETKAKVNDLDMTLFEQVDDPFDNLELQTINDMEELASVLKQTEKVSGNTRHTVDGDLNTKQVKDAADSVNKSWNGYGISVKNNVDEELPLYENVNLKVNENGPINGKLNIKEDEPFLDLTKLPPVPPRRDLVRRSPPLPPIGRRSLDSGLNHVNNQSDPNGTNPFNIQSTSSSIDVTNGVSDSHNNLYDNTNSVDNTNNLSFPNTETAPSPSPSNKTPVKKPPRTFKYSRHDLDETDAKDKNKDDTYENLRIKPRDKTGNFSVQYRNAQSSPDLHTNSSQELNFVQHHFGKDMPSTRTTDQGGAGISRPRPVPSPRRSQSPPSRPSSQQSWNRYSPLPLPGGVTSQPNTVALPPNPVIPPRQTSTSPSRPEVDPYTKLSCQARTSVDNLLTMGFAKDRTVRAVEKLGEDEKEVVEYLCMVDQLTEKGYNTLLVESALLLFQNNMTKTSTYLELFAQLQELGFSGEKIKDALIQTDNDREKALDILTAS